MAIDLPGKDKIGGIKKEYVYIGGGLLLVIGVVIVRSRNAKAAASTSTGTVTDPAGNVCAAFNPVTGYCPGTPNDLANSTLQGRNSASYVGGQIIGYDQYGNPIYSSSANQTGVPGGFTNNAQWAQAAQTELTQVDQSIDPSVIANALGVYINGEGATKDQRSIIEQGIAFEGIPPVGGTGGFPPSIKDIPNPPPNKCPAGQHMVNGKCVTDPAKCPAGQHWNGIKCVPNVPRPPRPPKPQPNVKIPAVNGLRASEAISRVESVGFETNTSPLRNPQHIYDAIGTKPSGSAPRGSLVIIEVKEIR